MLFFSMKPLTHVHVKCRLSCACFNIKFHIPVSLGFQKAKPQITQTNTGAYSNSCQTPIMKLF